MADRVLILGGGSGGTILANSLSRRRFDVTVLSDSDRHLFQPGLLYAAFTGSRVSLVRDERRLLARHVHFVRDAATRVDLAEQAVDTAGGERIRYDTLVVATGIRTDPSQIPGLAEAADQVGDYHSSVDHARRLWESLDRFRGGTIALGQATAICKCPPSPIEGILLADELLRRRGIRERSRLVFFTPYPRPYPAEPMNRIVEPILKGRGIEVHTFFDLDRIDPETGALTSIEGETVECDLPIVVPPFVGAPITYVPGDTLDENGFVRTDQRTLRVEGTHTAFAIGDATSLPTSKSGVGAHLEAKVVARTLAGRPTTFGGRTHCPLDVGGGRATFVAGTYDAPVVPSPPSRLKHLMKMAFARLYWLSLRGCSIRSSTSTSGSPSRRRCRAPAPGEPARRPGDPVGPSDGTRTARCTMTTAVLSPQRRAVDVRCLGTEQFDLLVVGGGITGAGAALDAATRGLRVALVEAQDWASGTSSRSSKLVHGGLRYLEMFDFHLVHQALVERGLLLQVVAPHLVHPVPILYPLRTPVVERAYVGAGIALYDALGWSTGSSRGLPLHRHLSRRRALALAPGLRRSSLAGAIEYYDAQVDDARYVAEVVRTAATYGAVTVSRAALVDVRRHGGRVTGAIVRDVENGDELSVSAAVTLLATGPWTEDTEAIAGRARAVKVRPSKGVHLVIGRDKIDSSVALVVRTEKSVLFVLPWGRHWLIGTTDTEWEHDKARPVATAADVDYLLEHVNRVLDRPLTAADVEATYAGLRPLVAGVGVVRGPGEQGAERLDRMAHEEPATTKVSREHAVARPAPGLVVVSGGKYTTYRVMAADAVDAAIDDGRLTAGASITGRVRLVGAEEHEARRSQRDLLAERHHLSPEVLDHLLGRYGGLVDEVLELLDTDRALAAEVPDGGRYLQAEVVYAVTHEGARHLDDLLLRRTRIGIETDDGGLAAAKAVADLVAPLLGWDDVTAATELDAYRRTVELEYLAGDRPADDDEAVRRTATAWPLFELP